MAGEMKITKYGHACLLVEKAGRQIIIDPGSFSKLPTDLSNTEAIVITHIHFDHLDESNLKLILAANPKAKLYGPSDVIEACRSLSVETVPVDEDMQIEVAGMELSFYNVDHAIIYECSPCRNLALKIDDQLYYPGDSLHVIDEPVKAVAVPLSAPWLKTSEHIDFALMMKAETIFPVHDALLNGNGQQVMCRLLREKIETAGKHFQFIEDGAEVVLSR